MANYFDLKQCGKQSEFQLVESQLLLNSSPPFVHILKLCFMVKMRGGRKERQLFAIEEQNDNSVNKEPVY